MITDNFLSAQWRKLIIANYEVDPSLLESFLPDKTEQDLFNGICYVSLVGFMFLDTKVKGFSIPFHKNFEEVNLRFYVKHKTGTGDIRRGVVFIKEIVPKPLIALVANVLYKEKYVSMKMSHEWKISGDGLEIKYRFGRDRMNTMSVSAGISDIEMNPGSEEEFITEHYWGYTKITDNKTSQYAVGHPRWKVYKVKAYKIDVDFREVYGERFSFLQTEVPLSVMLAEGSPITVMHGGKL